MTKYNLKSSSLIIAGTLGATALGVGFLGSGVVHAATGASPAPVTAGQEHQSALQQGQAKIEAAHQAADAQARNQYQQELMQAKTNQKTAELRAQRAYETTATQAQEQYQQDLTAAQQSVKSAANAQQ